jgi:non-homologous end joining protein Ku
VINLMDALKRSIEEAKPAAESRPRKPAAKAPPAAAEPKKRRKSA